MGDGNFRLPTEFTPLDRSPKHLVQVSMSAAPTAVTNLVQIRARGASGQMGKIQRNFYLFIYLYLFFINSPTGQTRRRIFTLDGSNQTTRTRARMCLWGFSWHCSPLWGWNPPKTPIFGARIGVFKPNGQNIESFMLSKLLHRFQPNFAQR